MTDPCLAQHSSGRKADFALALSVCAAGFAALAGGLTLHSPPDLQALVCLSIGLGLIGWSLLEYVVHRFVLHGGIQPFSTWHAAHHEGLQSRWAAMKTLLGAALVVGPALSLSVMLDVEWFGMGLSLGLLTGYAAHAAIHHWHCEHIWLTQRKFRHALHHDPRRPAGDYGVTSSIWDELLHTRQRQDF